MRMPGMTMFRMPIFTWNALITGVLVLMAFPPLASALLALGADRRFEANIFNPENGGPILWQHRSEERRVGKECRCQWKTDHDRYRAEIVRDTCSKHTRY